MRKMQLTVLASLVVSVSACMNASTGSGGTNACESGAQSLQQVVGMDAKSAFSAVDKMPDNIKNITIYAGSSETPAMLPKGVIVIGHDTPNAAEAMINGGKVTNVYCNR